MTKASSMEEATSMEEASSMEETSSMEEASSMEETSSMEEATSMDMDTPMGMATPMGAAISLRFALEERFSALRDSIASIVSSGRSSSRRSRSDSRHSAQDSTRSGTSPQQDSKRRSKEWIPKARAEDGTARKAGMTNVVEVVLEDPALAASPPQSPLSSQTSPKPIPSKSRNIYGTPWSVVTSKFVVGQMVFNAISSIGCSILLFYILFVLFVVPPGEPLLLYSWTHPNLIGTAECPDPLPAYQIITMGS